MEKINYQLNCQGSSSNPKTCNQQTDKCSNKGDKNKSLTKNKEKRKDVSINRYERKPNFQQIQNQTQYTNCNANVSVGRGINEKRTRNRGNSREILTTPDNRRGDKMNLNEAFDNCYQLSDGRKLDSKKRYNVTHCNYLLNFSFTPRNGNYGYENNIGGCKQKQIYPKFSKEKFLQANCQFIVRNGNDYSLHFADPDLPVNWDFIEEIRVQHFKSQITTCPICLHAPIAAKITKCGHIYCWSCILHYFALSDATFRKCPICYNSISHSDLRSVSFLERSEFNINDEIELKLIKCKRGSTLLNFVDSSDEEKDNDINKKLIVMNSNDVKNNIIEREFNQLCYQLIVDGQTPESCFIDNAIQCLNERKKEISEKLNKEKLEKEILNDSNLQSSQNVSKSNKQDTITSEADNYYFYQSSDGQHIYLNRLNFKMLCTEYQTYDKCPSKIKGKIISMDWSSITEENRKRYKYLQHLPLTCEYRTVELQLSPPLISEKTMNLYKNEINKRRDKRNRKEKEERKRDKKITKRNAELFEINSNFVTSIDQTQVINVEDSIVSSRNTSESEGSCIEESEQKASTSFASMLKKQSEDKISHPKQKVNVEENIKKEKIVYVASGDDGEEIVAKPLHQYSLSDAFEAALNLRGSKGRKNKKRK